MVFSLSADFWDFSAQLLRRPRQVSALAPSSRSLARMMANQLPQSARRVAEFGPGLGSITREILKVGIRPENLVLLEINEEFCDRLRIAFPGVAVHECPAQELGVATTGGLDAVVSGLPLLSMSRELQSSILSAAFASLAPDGIYIQFTYGLFPPLRRAVAKELGLTFTRTVRVWNNLPPATVYVYRRLRSPAPVLLLPGR